MSERRRWFFQLIFSIGLCVLVITLLFYSGVSDRIVFSGGLFFFSFLLLFNLYALRNYYNLPYKQAASRLRSMIAGNMDEVLPTPAIGEASDLFQTINDLSSELQVKSRMIDKLERMRIDFVANVSHELKTPLTSIKGYTETLKAGAALDPNVSQKFLDRIEENTNRLIAIISDLLVLSHIESFPQDVNWNTFETSQLTQKFDGTFMPNLLKKKQTLKLSFKDQKLEGDLKKLEHVFTNLVDNANRYCPEGATIEIKQTKDDLHWVFEVADNGPGIPAHHQARIFERFYRVETDRSRDTGGTGLGLSIVKHIVLLHDGSIRLESAVGQGTRFFIKYPRRSLKFPFQKSPNCTKTKGMKGIILAGGTGSRLFPLTKVTNKHLLPVGNKPMIFYPVEKLRDGGITEILIVTGLEHMGAVVNLLRKRQGFRMSFHLSCSR